VLDASHVLLRDDQEMVSGVKVSIQFSSLLMPKLTQQECSSLTNFQAKFNT
jgi:hypothetical protein